MSFDDLDINVLRRRAGKKWNTFEPDVLPAWVADMDFPVAPAIAARLQEMIQTNDLGYPSDAQAGRLVDLLAHRLRDRFGWRINPQRVELIADVMQGVNMCLQMFTEPGQGVLIHTPIYPPFLTSVDRLGRRADCCTLSADDAFALDPERVAACIRADTRLLLLCNPHNPTGRVFTRAELMRLAELAIRHDLVVVADEIHADLVFDGFTHIPFASLGPEIEARTVTLTSATKAFNIAGLRCAMMIFGSEAHHQRYRDGLRPVHGAIGGLGMHATEAAWTAGDDWLATLTAYLRDNRNTIERFLTRHLPDVRFLPPQATYLAWLDCRAFEYGGALWQTILDRGRLALNDGRDFGDGGDQCVRLNFATSRTILNDALERLRRALSS